VRRRLIILLFVVFAMAAASPPAQSPIRYRFTFPEPEHRWMQVEVSFPDLDTAPLELRMSRSSPGRYSVHDFAKNVYDVRAYGASGRELAATRSDPHGWMLDGHGGAATIAYKVFGDRLDGTYLAIDTTHAHINMPAAVMWAKGLDDRPATLTFDPPAGGQAWQVATQLHPGATPFEFTAPNLQYLMDSPVEFGPVSMRQFSIGDRTFRVAVHHTGTSGEAGDVDRFVKDVEKIVREEGEIFGEYPEYEPGHFTFLADYLPYAEDDAMEHRNSTVLTSRSGRPWLLDGVAHEFFHGWNTERIRPRSLEPFDFERANMSGELWLAEGFTQYYGSLAMSRAGLLDLESTAGTFGGLVASVVTNPARLVRSAEEMSRMAPFTDGGEPGDRTNWSRTVISYYQFGGAIALALDLTLRDRSEGRVTLDDYMRAMWRVHGKPGGSRQGYVDRPYTMADAEARLADVSGDAAFARDFFARYIRGRDVADYRTLLSRAGLVLRKSGAGRAWLGDIRLDDRAGAVRVAAPPPIDSPAYAARLDVDDEIRQLDGDRVRSFADVGAVLRRHKPGDTVAVSYVDRTGIVKTTKLTLGEDPSLELAPIESAGGSLTAAQKMFRERWLN
jgi:predicted metalloprotease with PDZ domain